MVAEGGPQLAICSLALLANVPALLSRSVGVAPGLPLHVGPQSSCIHHAYGLSQVLLRQLWSQLLLFII